MNCVARRRGRPVDRRGVAGPAGAGAGLHAAGPRRLDPRGRQRGGSWPVRTSYVTGTTVVVDGGQRPDSGTAVRVRTRRGDMTVPAARPVGPAGLDRRPGRQQLPHPTRRRLAQAVVDATSTPGSPLIDTADFRRGWQRGLPRRGARRSSGARAAARHQVRPPCPGPADEARGSRRYVNQAVRARCGGCAPTGSTCTSCTCPTRSPRSRRPSAPSTTWCTKGWSATRARRSSRLAGGRCRLDGPSSRPPRPSSAPNTSTASSTGPEADLLAACEAHGVGTLPFFPLANGLRTGKFHQGQRCRRGPGSATNPTVPPGWPPTALTGSRRSAPSPTAPAPRWSSWPWGGWPAGRPSDR